MATTFKGNFAITHGGSHNGDLLTYMNLRQEVYFRVEALQAMPFRDLLEQYVVPLQYLIGFGTNRPNSLTKIELYSTEKTHQISDDKVAETAISIYMQTRYNELREDKRLYSHDMLFSYQDITGNFGDVLEKWFALQGKIDSVVQLYFSIQQTPSMYLHQQFVNLSQAAESYHRRVIAPPGPPSKEHTQMLADIMAGVPEEHKEWLVRKLTYSHEPSLRGRLNELFDMTKDIIAPLVTTKRSFVSKVVDTRNYQTHYDLSTTSQAVRDNYELYYLTQVLLYMIRVLFLHELGLANEQIVQLFQRNEQYNFAVREHPKL